MSHDSELTVAPRPGRITLEESFLDLVDQIAQGDLETWQRLYTTALANPAARAAIQRASRLVDPDFASAGAVWHALVTRMPPVARIEDTLAANSSLESHSRSNAVPQPRRR